MSPYPRARGVHIGGLLGGVLWPGVADWGLVLERAGNNKRIRVKVTRASSDGFAVGITLIVTLSLGSCTSFRHYRTYFGR
jgi:hypothetical protein